MNLPESISPVQSQQPNEDQKQNLQLGGEAGFALTRAELTQFFQKEHLEAGQSQADLEKLEKSGKGLIKSLQSHKTNGIVDDIKEIDERTKIFGENKFKPAQLKSFMHFVWLASCDFCIRILMLCALLLFLVAFFTDSNSDALWQAISLLIAVLAVIFIQAITDYRKDHQFHQLFAHKAEQMYSCIRVQQGSKTGIKVDVQESRVVVGDIVQVKDGNYLEVDGVLVTGWVEVDQSSLTGKSGTITKRPFGQQAANPEDNHGNPFLRSGSSILNGNGFMLIMCVGENSLLGKMKTDIADHDQSSLLASSLETLAKFLVKLGSIFAMIMFSILMYYSIEEAHENNEKLISGQGMKRIINEFIEAFLIIVLSVPEGLPLIMTLGLSFAVSNLKKEGVIVRNLNSVTKIGGTDVIIFDKTGTLTHNQVGINRIFYDLKKPPTTVTSGGETLEELNPKFKSKLNFLIQNFTSDIHLEENSNGENQAENDIETSQVRSMKSVDQQSKVSHQSKGNPLDYALINLGEKITNDEEVTFQKAKWTKTDKFIVQSTFSGNLLKSKINENQYRIILKGSIGSLLNKCSKIFDATNLENLTAPLSESEREFILNDVVKNFEKKSMRVTCIVYRDLQLPNSSNDFNLQEHIISVNGKTDKDGFVLLTVLGLKDEVRSDSKKTIKECTQAGIRVMMLTGDSQGSALNVAHDVDLFIGLPEDENSIITNHKYASSAAEYFAKFGLAPGKKHDGVVTNTIPEDRREDFYVSVCTELKLLYEASAEDKLLIVNTLQSQNHTVGYVGDGNNDSKAMSHADVGFSMGGIGTQVAKQSSNIILAHDQLIGIISFIEWGRNIYYNLERFIYFQITFFSASVFLMIISSVTLKESPYSVLEVIWLSLIHDIVSAIALSTEKPKQDGERGGRPFKKNQNILNAYLVKIMVVQGIYQLTILIWILFAVPDIFGIDHSEDFHINNIGSNFNPIHAVHYTIVFHSTALIQITNLINARRVKPYEYNQFDRITQNQPFIFLVALCYLIQTIVVYFGGSIFKTAPLSFLQNLFCHLIAFGAFASFWMSKLLFSEGAVSTPQEEVKALEGDNQPLQANE